MDVFGKIIIGLRRIVYTVILKWRQKFDLTKNEEKNSRQVNFSMRRQDLGH